MTIDDSDVHEVKGEKGSIANHQSYHDKVETSDMRASELEDDDWDPLQTFPRLIPFDYKPMSINSLPQMSSPIRKAAVKVEGQLTVPVVHPTTEMTALSKIDALHASTISQSIDQQTHVVYDDVEVDDEADDSEFIDVDEVDEDLEMTNVDMDDAVDVQKANDDKKNPNDRSYVVDLTFESSDSDENNDSDFDLVDAGADNVNETHSIKDSKSVEKGKTALF